MAITMQLGFLGLGKMGSRMVEKLLEGGHSIVVWNRSAETVDNFKSQILQSKLPTQNVVFVDTIEKLVERIESPRIFWIMVPAGEATETVFQELFALSKEGDIIIDGGNANFHDTQRRFSDCLQRGVHFLGVGVSGGIIAGEEGYPLMVGGDKQSYELIQPILDTLSSPHGGHAYLGEGGVGHFVKMVHNGIEYGMMQAIGEGFGVLDKAEYGVDLLDVAKIWQKGTIISSFLIDRAKDALEKNRRLDDIAGVIDATGEAEWTIAEAKKEHIPVPVIEESLQFRLDSKINKEVSQSFAARMVAALRREFGGHGVKKK